MTAAQRASRRSPRGVSARAGAHRGGVPGLQAFLAALLALALCLPARAQDPTPEQKLYYACKVWGFVKYHHSRVSSCQVQWDSVLLRALPLIRAAATREQFNDALDTMLRAAGPMATPGTPSPDTLPPGRTKNRDFRWMRDAAIRADISAALERIRDDFRPRANCWIRYGDGSGGDLNFVQFPGETPLYPGSIFSSYPDEDTRTLLLFKFWNILRYFNPNNDILDAPWDSTLAACGPALVGAGTPAAFYLALRKITARMCDAHVEGSTRAAAYPFPFPYAPRLVLRHTPDGYCVARSDYPDIARGDILLAVDGKTVAQWEDSLRAVISAGNPAVFRKSMREHLLCGPYNSTMEVEYRDSLGRTRGATLQRKYGVASQWHLQYAVNDTLAAVKWRKWGCNVGYVNMGQLTPDDVLPMAADLQETTALIFDVRNYPKGTAGPIANRMFSGRMPTVSFAVPDVAYPGTVYFTTQEFGVDFNPGAYRGRFIILCDQETLSHAEWTCMTLRAHRGSIVVGSQTAGADGNVSAIRISDDISSAFTTLGIFYPNGDPTQRIGIIPDSVVLQTRAGILRGADEVLEKALRIAGCESALPVAPVPPVPRRLELSVPCPNPAGARATVDYFLPSGGRTSLILHDILGRPVARLFDGDSDAGEHRAALDVSALPSGVYFLTLRSATAVATSRVLVGRK